MEKLRYLKEIDFVSSDFQFKFKNEIRYKSYFGAIVSFIIFAITSSIGISFTIDVLEFANPSISLSNDYNENIILNFSKANYSVAFMMVDITGNILKNQDRYVSMIAVSYEFLLNNQTNYEISSHLLNLKKCSYSLINSNFTPYNTYFSNVFSPSIINNSYCFPSTDEQFYLRNSFATNNSRLISFYVMMCNNLTLNNTCKSASEITNILEKYYIYPFLPDIYFDHNNNLPANFRLNYKPFQLSSDFYKRQYFNYKQVTYKSDFGLFTNQINTLKYIEMESSTSEMNSFKGSKIPGALAEFTLTMSNQISDIYNRSYKKVPQLLAEIGGVFNVLFIVCQFLNSHIEKKLLMQEIFDKCVNPNLMRNVMLTCNKKQISSKLINVNKSLNSNFPLSNEDRIIYLKNVQSNSQSHIDGKLNSNLKLHNIQDKKSEERAVDMFENYSILFENSNFNYGFTMFEKSAHNFMSILTSCCHEDLKNRINFTERFYNQMFDIVFLFTNIIDYQISKKSAFKC